MTDYPACLRTEAEEQEEILAILMQKNPSRPERPRRERGWLPAYDFQGDTCDFSGILAANKCHVKGGWSYERRCSLAGLARNTRVSLSAQLALPYSSTVGLAGQLKLGCLRQTDIRHIK